MFGRQDLGVLHADDAVVVLQHSERLRSLARADHARCGTASGIFLELDLEYAPHAGSGRLLLASQVLHERCIGTYRQDALPVQALFVSGISIESATLDAFTHHEHGIEQRLQMALVLDVIPPGSQIARQAKTLEHRLGGRGERFTSMFWMPPDRGPYLLCGALGRSWRAPY